MRGKPRKNAKTTKLTPREQQVLYLVCEEACGPKEISRRLGIAEITASVHLHSIYVKKGASNLLELAVLTLNKQIVQLNKELGQINGY